MHPIIDLDAIATMGVRIDRDTVHKLERAARRERARMVAAFFGRLFRRAADRTRAAADEAAAPARPA